MKLLKDYHKVRAILEKSPKTPTFAYAICNNIIGGSVYVNDLSEPTYGYLRTLSGIYHVFGKPDNLEFNSSFHQYFLEIIKSHNERFTLFTPSIGWEKAIELEFKDYLTKMERLSYEFVSLPKKNKKLLNEYQLKDIDRNIIDRSENFNKKYFEEYWGTVNKFCDKGTGTCIIHGNNIVAECASIFHSGVIAEVDIITSPNYRGQGLGMMVGQAFIEKCLSKGVTPHWDCDYSNEESKVLAKKLGFDNPHKYAMYVCIK